MTKVIGLTLGSLVLLLMPLVLLRRKGGLAPAEHGVGRVAIAFFAAIGCLLLTLAFRVLLELIPLFRALDAYHLSFIGGLAAVTVFASQPFALRRITTAKGHSPEAIESLFTLAVGGSILTLPVSCAFFIE